MTIQEAIKKLEYQRRDFNDRMIDYGGVNDAYDMAIRSLEAWDKVTEDICKLHDNDKAYWNGVYDCLKIINKHLGEVTECR